MPDSKQALHQCEESIRCLSNALEYMCDRVPLGHQEALSVPEDLGGMGPGEFMDLWKRARDALFDVSAAIQTSADSDPAG